MSFLWFVFHLMKLIFLLKVLRHVKLEQQESEDFFVVGPVNSGSKVAPGMSITFTVGFTPKENKVNRREHKMT